jgi:hypothetical protein
LAWPPKGEKPGWQRLIHRWRHRWHYWHAALDALDDLRWEIRLRERRAMTPLPRADPPGTEPPLRPEHYASPELVAGAPLREPPAARLEYGAEPDHPVPPIVNLRGLVKQSLTKKSRNDLGQRMVEMCTLTGWQGTTLNPDMSDTEKLAILTNAYGKLATEDNPGEMYDELIRLSAVTMGWAQGIARNETRERRRRTKDRKRIRKEERAKAKKAKAKDKDG